MNTESTHQKNITYLEQLLSSGEIKEIPVPAHFTTIFFKSGGGNHLYLITADEKKYLARINYYHLKNEWQIKEHEYTCLKLIEPLQIAPRAYYLDATEKHLDQHVIIVDYVEGEVVTEMTPSLIVSLARTLKKLHTSVRFNRSGDRFPPTDELPFECHVYDTYAQGEDKQIEKYLDLPGIEKVIEPFNNTRKKLGDWFKALRCFDDITEFCLCHSDLKIENMLATEKGIVLIDWEQAGSYIPEMDIADVFANCSFSETQQSLFLEEYFGSPPDPVTLERIYAVKKVLDFFRIMEDYILLKRMPWDANEMLREIQRFAKTI